MLYLQLAMGFALLLAGGDLLVRGAVAIARRIGVSSLLIGLTLVGLGTSSPEMVTSIQAALVGSPGIAVGNVVGSSIANVLLVLGLAALIHPTRVGARAFHRDGAFVVLAALIAVAIALIGRLERAYGIGMLILLMAYIVLAYRQDKARPDTRTGKGERSAESPSMKPWVATLAALAGLGMIVIGARLLVASAMELARLAGISETVIGATLVAVGTSLPELATSLVAAFRRQTAVAFGNALGSNVFNVLGVLGVTAAVQPIPVPPEVLRLDVWVMLAATALLVVFATTDWRIARWEAALFVTAYAAYVAVLFLGFP